METVDLVPWAACIMQAILWAYSQGKFSQKLSDIDARLTRMEDRQNGNYHS